SQNSFSDSLASEKKQVPQRDIIDFLKGAPKEAVQAKTDTSVITPSHKTFIPILYPGYAQVTGFQIALTTNLSFYTDHSPNAKISSILVNNLYTQYNQLINLVNSNIWKTGGKFNLVGDYRFYEFPTNTFGLGSSSTFADRQHVDCSYLKIYEVAMRKIDKHLTAG